ncbi:hypothetical protein ACQUQU_12840 [Thalassolituus sp. LLYu03]|uniref:hypothetical protein n=1 Tax=Thalassolituus sp. LLYu03 TaxID=3421656 RepID=UPI003D2C38DE
MVKKTLLSLAIAATTAGLAGCNISSVEKYNDDVDLTAVESGQPGTTASRVSPIFSAGNADLPVNSDFLFSGTTDGTAAVTDSAPPVTTMINDLAGFSATATIDLPFNASLNSSTVVAGQTVFLIKLLNNTDDSTVDALDIASSVNASSAVNGVPFSAVQPVAGVDYTVDYVEMDNGASPTIRISPLKPLDSKTKYLVALTNGIKGADGTTATGSAEYELLTGDLELPSSSLDPVRTAVQAWEQLAGGFLASVSSGNITQQNLILTYAFTTDAKEDVLLSMAAPENYLFGLLKNTAGMESLLPEDSIDALVAGAALAINAANAATEGWVDLDPDVETDRVKIRLNAIYKTLVSNTLAKAIINGGAAKTAATGIAASNATIIGAINNWNAAYADKQISLDPTEWDDAQKGYIAQALGQYTSSTDNATLVATAANGAGALLKDASHRPAPRDFLPIGTDLNLDGDFTDASESVVTIPNAALGLTNSTATMQGMLTLPQFMERTSVDSSSFWTGSTLVGEVIDSALGNADDTTPPKDSDGSRNVTYRFPFAQFVEDVKVPVLVTYPTDGSCSAPYKTIIFQHGITTDRTSSLGFANQMAAPASGCFATVAIDHPVHGVDAATTDRNGNAVRYSAFNAFNVAGYVDSTTPANTPFAATLAAVAQAAGENDPYTGLAERHENLALNALQQPVAMSFVTGSESGNSGDFYINLSNMQQTRDHLRQSVMDLLNLNASIGNIDVDGDGVGDLDEDNIYFVGHSLGAIVGMTYVAVNNAVANNANILSKDLNPIKAAIFAHPGGQLPKLLENSPTFSAKILPGLAAAAGLTQGMSNLEKFFGVFQAPLDSVDPVNFTSLLKATGTPVLMYEIVGGGTVGALDSNTDSGDSIPNTGLSDTLIGAGIYPSDTVVPNNADPALNDVETGKSYLTGTDPLVAQLGLTTVSGSVADADTKLFLVSKFNQGTHGTVASADAPTVFAEMVKEAASFFGSDGEALLVGDATKLSTDD